MHQFAVDPEGSAGVGKIGSFNPAASDLRPGNALVEPGERDTRCGFCFVVSNREMSFAC